MPRLFKNLIGGSTLPPQQKGGMHTMNVLLLDKRPKNILSHMRRVPKVVFELTFSTIHLKNKIIVRKELSTPRPHSHFKTISPHYQDLLHFLKSPIHPPYQQIGQIFLINRNATVKLGSINNIHVKQQHNVSFFIFKFTLKYMPGYVYINKTHAKQCLYIINLYYSEGFSHDFNFFVVSEGILHV